MFPGFVFTLALISAAVAPIAPSPAASAPARAPARDAPSPCPSSAPTGAPLSQGPASSAPGSPAPCESLKEIGRVIAGGRKANLVGTAAAASEGTIGPEEISTRPILRAGELLEAIPGLVISQHSGEGKANQ